MANKNYPLYKVTPFYDFKEMLNIAQREDGNSIAFKYKEKGSVVNVTYTEFNEITNALGTGLASLGLNKEHMAIFSENSYKWVTAYLTVLKGAGVFVPVDKELPVDEMLYVINSSDSEVLFVSKHKKDVIKQNKDKLPKVRFIIDLDATEDTEDFLSYSKLIEKGKKLLAEGDMTYLQMENARDAMKMIVYTSGTTGTSKGVMLSLRNLVAGVYYGLQISTVYDTCVSVLPYHHTYEAVCGLLVSLHMHSTICINENLRAVAENLKLYKPSYIMLVPIFVEFLYSMIWKKAAASGKDASLRKLIKTSDALRKAGIDMRKTFFKSIHDAFGGRLKKIVCGGAPIRPELAAFFDSIGIILINGYGITECSPLVCANRDYFSDYTTVGVKLPCLDIKIDNPNENGEGEILVKGDVVMLGYYKNPQATKAVMNNGWFDTGDIGFMNDKEQLSITGRKKNLIVLKNGKNVYPEEIENYLLSIDIISEVVVYGIKDKNKDEVGLMAEVFPNSEITATMTDEEVKAKVNSEITRVTSKLPSYKHIAEIRLRDIEFEKTTSKKIKRKYN